MATVYKTADGTVFENETEARQYQAKLEAKSAKDLADTKSGQAGLFANYNAMIKFYNEGNWEKVIYYGNGIDDKKYSYSVYKWVLPDKEREQASQILNRAKEELRKLGVYTKKYTDDSGNVFEYDGEMVNGKLNGMGKETCKDGSVVDEGYFVNGILQNGKRTTPGGYCYEGEFKNTELYGIIIAEPSGKGKAKYVDGVIYEGDFKDSIPHGKGVMTYPDGKVEKGNFKNGKYKKGLFG